MKDEADRLARLLMDDGLDDEFSSAAKPQAA